MAELPTIEAFDLRLVELTAMLLLVSVLATATTIAAPAILLCAVVGVLAAPLFFGGFGLPFDAREQQVLSFFLVAAPSSSPRTPLSVR